MMIINQVEDKIYQSIRTTKSYDVTNNSFNKQLIALKY